MSGHHHARERAKNAALALRFDLGMLVGVADPRDIIPPAVIDGAVRIPLTQGKYALVDEEDYHLVRGYRWHARQQNETLWYAMTHNKETGRTLGMHVLIMRPPSGLLVDHEDGDGLNNRRSNLRHATHKQNQANRRQTIGRKYKGVMSYPGGRWKAQIASDGRSRSLGIYGTQEDAARAYDIAARRIHGEFARLNFPDGEPDAPPPDRSRPPQRNPSGYYGVSRTEEGGKWTAKIFNGERVVYLGTYDTPEAAARTYDAAAIEHRGEGAQLNFPDEKPQPLVLQVRSGSRIGYRGVYRGEHGARFQAMIRYAMKSHCLGTFDTAEEAARAYDEEARVRHGKRARLNFPDEAMRA